MNRNEALHLILSYKFRVYPNRMQAAALSDMLRDFCFLYNCALEQKNDAYKRTGRYLNYYDQAKELRAVRNCGIGLERWSFTAEQQVLRRLERTYYDFFRRLKRGVNTGFPRFKSLSRYRSADFRIGNGLTLKKSKRIGITGIPGEIKVKWHRELPEKRKSGLIFTKNGKWYVIFYVEITAQERTDNASVGIDVGLINLVAMSTGEIIRRPNQTKRSKKRMRVLQRSLSRCRIGSKRRAKVRKNLTTFQEKTANERRDFLHKCTYSIVERFSHIGIEKLNLSGLMKGTFAKELYDASWGQLISFLRYKAERAGSSLIEVNPRGTSQTCPECESIKPKKLSERWHICECGCTLDRDVAAAKVVHFRAFKFWPGAGQETLSGSDTT